MFVSVTGHINDAADAPLHINISVRLWEIKLMDCADYWRRGGVVMPVHSSVLGRS